jgi:catechol 1,2-dioxygenase
MTTDTRAAATAAHSGSAATEAFRESATRRETTAADSARIDLIARDLLRRVHDVIREHHLTYPEYQAVKQWLIEVGESGEWPLFLDVFAEHAVEEVATENRHGSKGTIEGPYYLPDQVPLPATATLPMRAAETGEPLVFAGQVRAVGGTPLAGAQHPRRPQHRPAARAAIRAAAVPLPRYPGDSAGHPSLGDPRAVTLDQPGGVATTVSQ